MSTEPLEEAHALLERLFALLLDCRRLVRQLEPDHGTSAATRPSDSSTTRSSGRSRPGLVRMSEDLLAVFQQASRPLGPMGEEWLKRQRGDGR